MASPDELRIELNPMAPRGVIQCGDLERTFKQGEEQALNRVNSYIYALHQDPNEIKDVNSGDTFLHLAARYNYKSVAVLVLGEEINALAENNDKKIALEIAITNNRDDMSAVIARNMKPADLRGVFESKTTGDEIRKPLLRLNNALIGNECDFTETLLAVFDSLRIEKEDGSVAYDTTLIEEDAEGKLSHEDGFNDKDHTLFQNLAEHGYTEAINHRLLRLLINIKWNKWAKKKFMLNFVLYLISLSSLTFVVAVAGTTADVTAYDTRLQHSRAVFEIISYCFVLKAISAEIIQVVRHGRIYCKQLLNLLELLSVIILLSVLPVRYINVRAHWYIFAFGYLLWVIKIFKYAVVFSETGAYAESLKTIFWRNFIPFCVLFGIINLAFGGTFLLVLKGDGDLDTHDDTSSLLRIWYIGLRTMIEAQPIVEYTGPEGYRTLGAILMLLFMGLTIVVLLNILIAQLTGTYEIIQSDARKSVVVNRAWIIARLERNASKYPRQCIPKCLKNCLPECLKPYLEVEENRKIRRFLSDTDIEKQHDQPTPLEQINSAVARIENKLTKTDLKVQTVKTRLRMMDKKLK